jgi:four helix bundle protein
VPANIAEGHYRGTTAEFMQFLRVARASLGELRTLLRIAANVGYLNEADFAALKETMTRCMQLLGGLMKSLEKRKSNTKTS